MKTKSPVAFICQSPVIVLSLALTITFVLLAVPPRRATVEARSEQPQSPAVILFEENFDGVTAPQLPAGWTTSITGSNLPFRTSVGTSVSPPNKIETNNPATAGSSEITSPPITVGGNSARLTFRHSYETEPTLGYDGGVLEISINGSAFQDILAAGGVFYSGGYTQALQPNATGNPLLGRQVWTGNSAGFIRTTVILPASALNRTIRLRWQFGTDQIVVGVGWRIDDVRVDEYTPSTIAMTFSNSNPINIPVLGSANPYPSAINVANQGALIERVTVKLKNFSHQSTGDVDIMLVGPGGQSAAILSDVSAGAAAGLDLTLDEAAANSLPVNFSIASGAYRPRNDAPSPDPFPAPAPSSLGNSTLSVFQETNPGGVWNLYVVDDANGNTGTITGGWELTIFVANQFSNTNAIAIPEIGSANPYPSTVSVAGLSSTVTKVQVRLNNFSHASPDDVDLLLVAPNGRSLVLMSDVGGANPVNNLSLTFDDSAAASLPDSGQIAAGIYKPTDFQTGDEFPAPAPPNVSGRTLGTFAGGAANGEWKLFLVDDAGSNAGSVAGGWTVIVDTANQVIAVPSSGAAQPYPSEQVISGLPGLITKATVTLSNFSHASPDDLDVLLVAPSGRRIVLMSDVGGATEIGSVNLTFDDAAAASLPDDAPLVSGSYKPTNYETDDVFPAPAPQGATTGATLNAFYGSAPNGIWRLFVVDDTGENAGTVAGWNINLETSTTACTFSLSPSGQGFPITGGSGSFAVNMPSGCPWTASTNSSFVTITSNATGEGAGSVSYTVAPNMNAGRTASIVVSNGVFSQTFLIQQPSGCPFALDSTMQNVPASGGARNVAVTAGVTCAYLATSNVPWIQITSPSQTGDGTVNFTVAPNPTGTLRSGTITIGARTLTVNQAGSSAKRFDFDGDGKADVSVYRPANGTWYIQNSQNNSLSAAQFGVAADRLAPADYDGDRKTDYAVFRDGVWHILQSQTNTTRSVSWGLGTDAPTPGDYDGDGKSDLAVFRAAEGNWYVLRSGSNTSQAVTFGAAADQPVPADYDGDGRTDFAVYRAGASSGWFILQSGNNSVSSRAFGTSGDIALAGDYDGDGRDNIAIFRPSTGTWYLAATDGDGFEARQFGQAGDVPVAADYNGDGRMDIGVFRAGAWYILLLGSETFRTEQWGLADDRAVPAAFNRQ